MRQTGIYVIENRINGKKYVGQAVDILRRWREHRSAHTTTGLLNRAFAKYGVENFAFSILEECALEQLNEKEKFWIAHLNSYNKGYNMTLGGEGGTAGNLLPETILQIAQFLREDNLSFGEIANKFEVHEGTIAHINNGRQYNHNLPPDTDFPIRERYSERARQRFSEAIKSLPQNVKDDIRQRKIIAGILSGRGKPVLRISDNQLFLSRNEAAKAVGLKSSTSILNVCEGKGKTAGGYQWRYLSNGELEVLRASLSNS